MNENQVSILKQIQALPAAEQAQLLHALNTSKGQPSLGDLLQVKQDKGIECPYCRQKEHIVKFGVRKGVQWYKCKGCGHTFSSLSDSILNSTKKELHVWMKYITCMIDGLSVRKSAEVCNINKNTAFIWRHKILDALTVYAKKVKLGGIVELDDTYTRVSYKGTTPPNRQSYKRGTPASKRGISSEQVCVSCAVSRSGKVFSKVSAIGRVTAKALNSTFGKRIISKSILCTDKEGAYKRFAKDKELQLVQLESGKKVLGVYHIQHINAYHSRLKQFIMKFKGVSTKHLNNYLSWFNVIVEGKRNLSELAKLIIRAVVLTLWSDVSKRPAIPV